MCPSRSSRAHMRARSSSRRPSSCCTSSALSAVNGSSTRPSPASVAPSSSAGASPWSVRTRKCPRPSRATTVQTARQRSESLSQASTSGLGTRSGKLRQQRLDRLGHARVRGHAPVLAAPVEPAPRQLLDGLVQVLVEGEIEDDLRLARVVRKEPHLARRGDRLVLKGVSGQTVELSCVRTLRTGAPLRPRAAPRAARPRAPAPAPRRTAR